jgi:hypothetical protein
MTTTDRATRDSLLRLALTVNSIIPDTTATIRIDNGLIDVHVTGADRFAEVAKVCAEILVLDRLETRASVYRWSHEIYVLHEWTSSDPAGQIRVTWGAFWPVRPSDDAEAEQDPVRAPDGMGGSTFEANTVTFKDCTMDGRPIPNTDGTPNKYPAEQDPIDYAGLR